MVVLLIGFARGFICGSALVGASVTCAPPMARLRAVLALMARFGVSSLFKLWSVFFTVGGLDSRSMRVALTLHIGYLCVLFVLHG